MALDVLDLDLTGNGRGDEEELEGEQRAGRRPEDEEDAEASRIAPKESVVASLRHILFLINVNLQT